MDKELVLYVLFILITVIVALRINALSRSGAIAAFFVGLMIFPALGWRGLLLMGLFFVSSSAWSFYKNRTNEKVVKGNKRDWRQVLANGGPAAVCALLFWYSEHSIWLVAYLSSIAGANSDTWASEIGRLSKTKPILIPSFERCDQGTSGAVSGLGTIASLCGSLVIALFSAMLFPISASAVFIIVICGFFGSLVDTIIGATLQVRYQCTCCGMETERTHHCDLPTKQMKGVAWIDNDTVNLLSIAAAGLLSLILSTYF